MIGMADAGRQGPRHQRHPPRQESELYHLSRARKSYDTHALERADAEIATQKMEKKPLGKETSMAIPA